MVGAREKSMASRVQIRLKIFTDSHPFLGPTVYMSSVLYFVAQIVVAWNWKPPYSVVRNNISDLGNTHCGKYGLEYVCSTHHFIMNSAFILLGVIMAVGSTLIYQEFTFLEARQRMGARVGFAVMGIAGIGAILVGSFPENSIKFMHLAGAAVAITLGNVAIFILGWYLPLSRNWRDSMRWFSLLAIVAFLLFVSHRDFGVGNGTMERFAQYPQTIWLILFGIYISRDHYSRRRRLTTAGNQE